MASLGPVQDRAMHTLRFFVPAVTLAALLTTAVLAHKGATGVVKERMDQMGTIAKSMKAMGAMFKGAVPYDADTIAELSRKIAGLGGDRLTAIFPDGSLQHPSEALPTVWSDWDRFSQLAEKMKVAASALAEGAGNDREGAAARSPDALFRELASTCKSCHQDFRIKK